MKTFLSAAALIVIYILIFLAINIVHFLYFPVRVVLYDTLLDIVIGAVPFAILYVLVLRKRLVLSRLEFTLSLLVSLLIAVNYAISIPTVIDRSLSAYILEKLAQRGGAIQFSAFPRIFTDEYMKEHRLVDIRLTEQLESGTIVIENGCVRLTDRGRLVASITRFYRTHFLPKHREIMGAYTDALTDPFRNSTPGDYACAAPAPDGGKTK
ncbi:hypothetical protein SAMN05444161_3469 [Rhizobiales bacterium GAS191]|nr:hypothetical protein SAMN05519103_02636 [Rhizobiales bacterium GAS113]SED55837.1 hypothetical protein SAMN05444161_3469 [Rhizobiales bacterium GAS191]SEE79433.1 hypothetical protein SAMN05519104_7511 [Rhizobiales bacterium GAS188]